MGPTDGRTYSKIQASEENTYYVIYVYIYMAMSILYPYRDFGMGGHHGKVFIQDFLGFHRILHENHEKIRKY